MQNCDKHEDVPANLSLKQLEPLGPLFVQGNGASRIQEHYTLLNAWEFGEGEAAVADLELQNRGAGSGGMLTWKILKQ